MNLCSPLRLEELIENIPLEDAVEQIPLQPRCGPAKLLHALESTRPTTRRVIWRVLDEEDRNQTLQYMSDEVRAEFLEAMDTAQLVAAADELNTDDFADILQQLPKTISEQVLAKSRQQRPGSCREPFYPFLKIARAPNGYGYHYCATSPYAGVGITLPAIAQGTATRHRRPNCGQ